MRTISFEGNVNGVLAEGVISTVRIGEIVQPLVVDGDYHARRAAGMREARLEIGDLNSGEARLFFPWMGRRVRVTVEILEPPAALAPGGKRR